MSIIRVFDIETTGVDPETDRIIEIAGFDVDTGAKSVQPAGDILCDPGRDIPSVASAVHHLTNADVDGAASFTEIWPDFAGVGISVYAAHNAKFESGFLPVSMDVDWLCTYKCALHAWPDAPSHSNQALRYWLGFDSRPGFDRKFANSAHRAAPDAYVTAHILLELLERATVAQLVLCSQQPARFPVLSFGKHYGAKWAGVPSDYLVWLRDGVHEMDEDWRHCARRELARR